MSGLKNLVEKYRKKTTNKDVCVKKTHIVYNGGISHCLVQEA